MVAISKKTASTARHHRTRGFKGYDMEKIGTAVVAIVVVGWIGYFVGGLFRLSSPQSGSDMMGLRHYASNVVKHHHAPKLPGGLGDEYGALAEDVIRTLDCASILPQFNETNNRRRLQEEGGDGEGGKKVFGDDDMVMGDVNNDDLFDGDGGVGYLDTAKTLFCLAATNVPNDRQGIQCDASGSKRKTLLDLWGKARSEMSETVLLKALDVARERSYKVVGHSLWLWSPSTDQGVDYMLQELNAEDKTADEGASIRGLENNLGSGKLFVDVGSCLGLTSMAVALLYPGTKIVSLEPAGPNWLMQELNFRCNDSNFQDNIASVLAGVGPMSSSMAKLLWRARSTTSTRAWTPAAEHLDDDLELVVRLRPLSSLLTEAGVAGQPIDVLNIDCEGCEYNLVPSLSQDEFDAIPTVMGSVHWGYIPSEKLPSSKRGRGTHERLCRHENIARNSIECCAFPGLEVKSSVPGEVLVRGDHTGFPPKAITVADVAGELCKNFPKWAEEHHLYDVEDDYGWFELTSQAS